MPWKILGLESDATERDVKRAYARLLKLHRPDKDPEGFAKINEAYEEAKRLISWRGEDEGIGVVPAALVEAFPHLVERCEVDDSGFEGGIELPVEVVDPLSLPVSRATEVDVFAEWRVEIAAALRGGDLVGAERGLRAMNRICVDRPDQIPQWGRAVSEAYDGYLPCLASSMPHVDLLRELEYEENAASMAVLGGWEEAFETEAMRAFAEAILADAQRYESAAAAVVWVRLAQLLAIVYPTVAEKLANHAFGMLSPDQRHWYLDRLEQLLMAGALFKGFRSDQRAFWAQRITVRDGEWDWESGESKAAVRYLHENVHFDWSGYNYLEPIVPETVWGLLQGGRKRKKDLAIENVQTSHLAESTGGSGWRILFLCFILIKTLVYWFGGCDGNSSQSRGYESHPQIEDIEKGLETVSEIRRLMEERSQDEQARRGLQELFPSENDERLPEGVSSPRLVAPSVLGEGGG